MWTRLFSVGTVDFDYFPGRGLVIELAYLSLKRRSDLDIENSHGEKFVSRVAVEFACAPVDIREHEVLDPTDEHEIRRVIEK